MSGFLPLIETFDKNFERKGWLRDFHRWRIEKLSIWKMSRVYIGLRLSSGYYNSFNQSTRDNEFEPKPLVVTFRINHVSPNIKKKLLHQWHWFESVRRIKDSVPRSLVANQNEPATALWHATGFRPVTTKTRETSTNVDHTFSRPRVSKCNEARTNSHEY